MRHVIMPQHMFCRNIVPRHECAHQRLCVMYDRWRKAAPLCLHLPAQRYANAVFIAAVWVVVDAPRAAVPRDEAVVHTLLHFCLVDVIMQRPAHCCAGRVGSMLPRRLPIGYTVQHNVAYLHTAARCPAVVSAVRRLGNDLYHIPSPLSAYMAKRPAD